MDAITSLAKRCCAIVVVALVVLTTIPAVGQDGTAEADLCGQCHEAVVAAFAANPHATIFGRKADASAPCAPCHAGGAAHAASGDPADVAIPSGAAGEQLCLSCHAGALRHDIEPKGVHATRGIYCGNCHIMHPAGRVPEALLAAEGSSLCVSCHVGVMGSFRKTFAHRMHRSAGGTTKAGMQCASCHNPHGRGGEESLLRTRSGEVVCLSCHTDKRGPFVYSHMATEVAGCGACHEPHGSANPMMLKRSRVAQLCLECHSVTSPATLGSQPPSFHDLRSPRYQNCTTCHVAVHGSNSSALFLR